MSTITVSRYASKDKDIPSMPHKAFAITPSDTDTFDHPVMIKCTVAGNVNVVPFAGDEDGTATALVIPMAVGEVLEFCVQQVKSNSTTATVIGIF